MHNASTYVRVVEERTGLKIGCIEEIAWRNKWINSKDLVLLSRKMKENQYSEYLERLAQTQP